MNKINYQHELLTEASKALKNRDVETLERLQAINNGWLQTDTERNAVNDMLESMIEAVYELELKWYL